MGTRAIRRIIRFRAIEGLNGELKFKSSSHTSGLEIYIALNRQI